MNDIAVPATWLDANHRYLCAAFSRLRAIIDGQEPWDDLRHGEMLESIRSEMHEAPAIEMLAASFGLTDFERDALLLAAGVEMDPDLAQALAKRSASILTFGAALALLRDPHWSALSPARPLRHWGLVSLASEGTPVRSPLHVDERVLFYLAGVNALDARLDHLARKGDVGQAIAPEHAATAARIAAHLRRFAARGAVIQLVGDDADGQEQVAAHAVAEFGLSLLVLHADELPTGAADRLATARLAVREGVLLDSAWVVRVSRGTPTPCAAAFVDALAGPTFVSAAEALPVRRATRTFRVARPGSRARLALWRSALGSQGHSAGIDLDAAAAQHRWSARSIERAAQRVLDCLDAGDPGPVALREGCRAGGPTALDELAQRLDPAATWNELVLPGDAEDVLREIAGQVRNRLLVHDDWGMGNGSGRGLGITALFAGEPGTGKTMAAEVLANALALDLYRIDLSTVVSKYVGETEKNLKRVFDAAEASGAILLFDEADALFGRRSEVKDSHDRYANIEVSYLLQRMEAYDGLAILTTNAKASMDRAFQRRLRFVVHFPFPDAAQRERLWRAAFPPATPTEGLDIPRLAALRVAGGGVRNIALNAAFRAARDRRAVGMRDLLAAARGELAKSDKPLTEAETRGWT
jgi:hypothetical protein